MTNQEESNNFEVPPEEQVPRILSKYRQAPIPVGPRYQADLPDWAYPQHILDHEGEQLKWLGTTMWPITQGSPKTNGYDVIGKGRPESCACASPGSIECVRLHVNEERARLQFNLGPAYFDWGFHWMGENVTELWNPGELRRIDTIMQSPQGSNFMEPALNALPEQTRKSVAHYYFNVYFPTRISIQTRSGSNVDTDDEGDDALPSSSSDSRKRSRDGGSGGPGVAKNRLTQSMRCQHDAQANRALGIGTCVLGKLCYGLRSCNLHCYFPTRTGSSAIWEEWLLFLARIENLVQTQTRSGLFVLWKLKLYTYTSGLQFHLLLTSKESSPQIGSVHQPPKPISVFKAEPDGNQAESFEQTMPLTKGRAKAIRGRIPLARERMHEILPPMASL
ncbi:hypothetical protein RJ640_015296 [Escallonia rubra]|uniref:Uncharacterized protein n=1 Tax=Escallonia rubra TaxID=112253 RepID=A0AA88RJY5_9ASTE|nr:hypothetical protein RJ640_015296 [Escallonia rubra]